MSAAGTVPQQQPVVLAARSSGPRCELDLRVPADLPCFAGHFPQVPLLPGVVQIGWAVALAGERLALPSRFTHLAQLKFMRVIEPGDRVTLALEFMAERNELAFSYRHSDGRDCSSGRIGYAHG